MARRWIFLMGGGLRLMIVFLLLSSVSPVFAVPTTPTSDFTDNGDGTVTHQQTGLTWMRCALGQTWTGTTCSGTIKRYPYATATALKKTANFAGHTDWRLPNITELQTLVERDNLDPAVNTEVFPSAPSDAFWSSSPYVGKASHAWIVRFAYGYVDVYSKSLAFAVRLVRANQSLDTASPNADFTDNNDGTVTHKSTCLMWQRCSVGQTWNGSTCAGSASTYTFDAAQRLSSSLAGYDDWRVPTANELARLVDYTKAYPGPTINTTLFPNTISNAFWSSSPYVGSTGNAWGVNFSYGFVYNYSRFDAFPVRLVRASQCLVIGLKPDLATTLSASTDRVQLKQNLTYTATVTNQGTGAATNATLIFYFPPRWTNTVSKPADCETDSTSYSYRCHVGTLAAGASVSRAITVNFAQRGATSIGSLALTDSTDSDKSNNLSRLITSITP